jgi:hypothetical protein
MDIHFCARKSTTTTFMISSTRVLNSKFQLKVIVRSQIHFYNTAYEQFHQDTETGPGVLETALAYTSALRMADNALLFKYLAKSIGMKHGVIPSFMAKPWGNVRVVHPVCLTRSNN